MSKEEICLKLTEIEYKNKNLAGKTNILSSFLWYMEKLYGGNENE